MKFSIFIYITLWLSISCTSKVQELSDKVASIEVENKKSHPVEASDFIKRTEIIKLKINEGGVIGRVDKIRFFEEKFYLLDISKTKTLKVFDRMGRFVYQITRHVLKTSDKLINIDDFDIDENGNVQILDGKNQKIYKFNKDGKYMNELVLPVYCFKFMIDKDGYVFFKNKTANNFEDATLFYDILMMDSDGTITAKFKPFSIPKGEFSRIAVSQPFSRVNNDILYVEFLNDTIWRFDKNKLTAKYYVDFTSKMNDKYKNKIILDYKVLLSEKNNKYAFGINFFNENDKMLFFQYTYGRKSNFYYINKNTEKVIITDKLINDFDGGIIPFPINVFEDKMISVLDEFQLIQSGLQNISNDTKFTEIYNSILNGNTFIILSSISN